MDVYNFTSNTWTERFDMPKKMSNSHLGMASDGRYIYAVAGQFGPQCRPAVSRNFVLDTKLRKWDELPPLPVPRYAFQPIITCSIDSKLVHMRCCNIRFRFY